MSGTALSCMGGWCKQRDTCPHHLPSSMRRRIRDRLCEPGRDGVLRVEFVRKAPAEMPAIQAPVAKPSPWDPRWDLVA